MNWSKTKDILIAALILTNLFLISYLALGEQMRFHPEKQDQEAFPAIVQELRKHQIILSFDSPPSTDRVHGVEASYELYTIKSLAQQFWKEGYQVNGNRAQKGTETLEVVGKNQLIYKNPDLDKTSPPTSPDRARSLAEAFLTEHGFPVASEMEWRMSGRQYASEIYIYQTVNRRFVDNGYIHLKVTADGISYFERKWFSIDDIHEMNYTIKPPGRALMQLSEMLLAEGPLKKPLTVSKMELGYQLNSDVFNSTIYSGELSLYWRFTVAGRPPMYVNALE